jgi:hypothetical protein
MSVEQWAVNKAVHYNEWANFGRTDFQPVVMRLKSSWSVFSVISANRGSTSRPALIRNHCAAHAIIST